MQAPVVDLQALDLDGIGLTDGTVTLGAMTTLNSMSRSEAVPGVLRELARREAPSTIRNVATVGGTVGGRDGLSGLLAGLLAFGAVVELATKDGSSERSLAEVLADKSSLDIGIITSVSIMTNGEAALTAPHEHRPTSQSSSSLAMLIISEKFSSPPPG